MKIGITGASKGLGSQIKEHLESNSNQVYEFQRSNGFDISKPEDRHRVNHQLETCDIFINNSFANGYQLEMCFDFFHQFKDTDKHMIVIGSRAAHYANAFRTPSEYASKKAAVQKACQQMFLSENQLRVTHLSPGYFELPQSQLQETPIQSTDFLSLLDFVILSPKSLYIGDIVFKGR